MRHALVDLLDGLDRFSIFVRLPRTYQTNGQAGQILTLFEDDGLDLSSSLDTRLVRSRSVQIVIASRSEGAAQINLTARRWEILQDSPEIRERLNRFGAALRAGKRSRFITVGYVLSALTFPLWFVILMLIAWTLGDPADRNFLANPKNPTNAPLPVPFPHWFHDLALIVIASWPLWVFAALMMGATYYLSGGLLVWPEVMTFASAARAIHNLRVSLFTLANFNALVVAVIAAVIGVIFGVLITHL